MRPFDLGRRVANCLAGLCLAACHSVPVAPWTVPEGALVQVVNGYPMTFSDRGAGPIVVLVGGVLTDYRVWQRPLNPLEGHYRFIAVSPRHFFPEQWDGRGTDFNSDLQADDLNGLIENLGQPVFLVGWSYGGRIAFKATQKRPDLVKKLVLVEAPMMTPASPSMTVIESMADGTVKFFEAGDVDGGLGYALDIINGPGAWDRTPEVSRTMLRDNAWTVVGAGRDKGKRVTCADFGSLNKPILLVEGELTTPFFKQVLDEESRCLPTAAMATIPKVGHSSPLQNPQAFRQALESFLQP